LTSTKDIVESGIHDIAEATDAELAILRVLWSRGPSTVRQVHDALTGERATGYTTALKLLQIMSEKGLVARDETDRSHVYSARLSEGETQRQLAGRPARPRVRRIGHEACDAGTLGPTRPHPRSWRRSGGLIDEKQGGMR
jgi:hypothetical protein